MLCFLENLFDFTYYFVNILTYHASVFPLTAGRLLLFNKYLWSICCLWGTAGCWRCTREHRGFLSSWSLHVSERGRCSLITDECVNYKLNSAVKERTLYSMREHNRRTGLNLKKCPLNPRMSRSYLSDKGGALTFLTRGGQHHTFWWLGE